MIKEVMTEAKYWTKSKMIQFNMAMLPVISYLVENRELWDGYAGHYANAFLIIGNIILRLMTTQKLSEK
ncbi:MAG: hypothetical protein GY928_01045 [Colwellia sp.]|nr:hypothetical protein [Colwellia sp.]